MLEFFFDCSSPWTYLAFHNIQPMAAQLSEKIVWRPILVGGIFNTVNPTVYQSRQHGVQAKQRYMLKDLQDWSRRSGLSIKMPPSVFPVNSVKAMRGCIALSSELEMLRFAKTVFEAYWRDDQDISQDATLKDVCIKADIDPDAFFRRISDPSVKDQLRVNTDEVIARGGFGSPTIFLDEADMYFGNDRLPLIREAILRRNATQT